MNYLKGDSALVRKLIARGREITQLIRETVTYDRKSKKLSHGGGQTWTNAAQNRDHSLKLLRKILEQIAEDL